MLNENIKNILPITSQVNEEGILEIGGCNLEEISNIYGTPLYVYDESTIREICKEFVNEFKQSYPNSHISYSSKAFSSPHLTKILEDENLRQGIKDFSDWPTIPQLYVKGEFIGGCDIVKDMFEKGELKKILEEKKLI